MRGPMKQVRLVVLGAGGVGKSSLVSQFMRGVFNTFYEPTVEECYRHFLHLPDGNMHCIEILDTGGTHQFPAMQELNIKTAHGFIIVYSIDDAESFKEAHKLRKLVVNVKGTENIPLVMVGNKSDLAVDREVQKDEAVTAAREEWRCPFLETSAKYNRNVYDIFLALLNSVETCENRDSNKQKGSEKRRSSASKTISTLKKLIRSRGNSCNNDDVFH
ncbi:ras-related protein Rap-1A-like [Branchiostoma floridae]|uniref:Ras-related protein Rap-1A-like n=1 Tax=Branchiostoma floridae TaxID=7739 RepID=A0A9J7KND3_BRAFL|nr:ras-related protein Rap-1A-like [Branchiostoma floridae]